MGKADNCTNTMTQTSLVVHATRTVYTFDAQGVTLQVTFTTPSAMVDTTLLSFNDPVSYIQFEVHAQLPHSVQLYYDNTAEITVNDVKTLVEWARVPSLTGDGSLMRIGAAQQNPLSQQCDYCRIAWGWWYLYVPTIDNTQTTMASADAARSAFFSGASLPADDTNLPRACNDNWPVLAVVHDFGNVDRSGGSFHLTISYDDVYSLKYFGAQFKAAWTQRYPSVTSLIADYDHRFANVTSFGITFDTTVEQKLMAVGGQNYSSLGTLVYRQTTGALKLVWNDRKFEYWVFLKEISSNGDMSTVDVIFPASPLLLYFSPETLRLLLLPLLEYAQNQTAVYGDYIPYNLQWAPHHLGTYPVAAITADDQEQMPMEETGNMFMMLAAIAQRQNCNVTYLEKYSSLLAVWGRYLNSSLPDPEDQLCTDDFEGPSPHNVNLAAKGIVGLAAYSDLLRCAGKNADADMYRAWAEAYVPYWIKEANDGDHYRLQYNLSGTWSVKYNLLGDVLLGLHLFPADVYKTEISYYLTQQMNQFGFPLDNRQTFAKADWSMWAAAMAPQHSQFITITNAIYSYVNATTSRVPVSDWYQTTTGEQQGFQARPVMGGVFAGMLRQWP